jgi:hypothetical protein
VNIGDWYALLPLGLTALFGVGSVVAECARGRRGAQTVPVAAAVADSRTGSLARVDHPRGDVRGNGPRMVVAGAGRFPQAPVSATHHGHPS